LGRSTQASNKTRADKQSLQRHVESTPDRGHLYTWLQLPLPITTALVFAWLAATSWMRPLALPDEGRYVGVAWEMVRSGNWLVPTLDTLPFFHKPPLFYWLTAGTIATFGNFEWAARLPTVLAATAAVIGLFSFLRRWVGQATAVTALLVIVTMPYFFVGAQFANLDMLVAACITGTILCAADVVLAERHRQRLPALTLVGAYLFAALGLLAKGLIAIVIPVLVVGLWLVSMRNLRLLVRLVSWPGMLVFMTIAVPWFALMETWYSGFLDYFFIHHHVQRFLTSDFNGKQPWWFYVPLLFAVTLPWSLFLPWAWRKTGENKVGLDLRRLLWIWLAATLVFFSIPSSKLVGYVLPAAPALAALVALAIINQAGTWIGSRRNSIANAVVAATIGLVGVWGYAHFDRKGVVQMAAAVRPQLRPGDRLLALWQYPFSLSFYLRSEQPIIVVEDWMAPSVQLRDNWRKELYDAGKFDVERAKDLLLVPSQLPEALCAGRTWILASARDADHFPGLRPTFRNSENVVWLSEPSEPSCPHANR
jgi:4-amino-4-deoxy-L-arabinose transferase-like glycosyltransferase